MVWGNGMHASAYSQNRFCCENDDIFLDYSTAPLVTLISRQSRNLNSDIGGNDHDRLNFTILLIEVDGIKVKRRMEVWNIPVGDPIIQTFPPYLRHFISQLDGYPKLQKR